MVPVVGMTPLKSLEQLAPGAVFVFIQLLQLCDTSAFLKVFGIDRESITVTQRLKVRCNTQLRNMVGLYAFRLVEPLKTAVVVVVLYNKRSLQYD